VVGVANDETLAVEVMLVQVTVLDVGSITVQEIVAAGSGAIRDPDGAETYAVSVVDPPRVCGVEAETEIVGSRWLIFIVAEFVNPGR
jgi:hypothetical protein